ncbi:MAG: trigger factor [Clostridia bacterium]|nr:trigger factor [Clostridia bacterium]
MSLINVTTPEKNVRELEIGVEKAVFDKACSAVYKRNVGKINVPGFRKGKAPRSIIEKMYGTGVFYEEALNDLIPEAYEAAVKESGLVDIVSRPEFDVKSIDDNGVVLLAKVYVKPEVTVKDYKGIEVEKTDVSVSDADIDAEIEKLRERNSREIEVTDRAAQMGDTVVFDFDGSVDGVAFDGGKSENYSLKLGSGQFIPGFEEQIVGKSVDEAFDVNVTFPEDYHAAELAGKAAVFACKLHEIKEIELPALDDEFVKDISEFDTLDEYKADLRAKMEEKNKSVADNAVEETLIAKVVENMEADIPAPMIENEVENQVRDFDFRLRQQGMDLKTYFQYTGLDLDGMREQFKPMAERQVKARLALEGVVAAEGITASDEEIAEEYEKLAKAYNMGADEVKKYVDDDSVAKDITVRKAVELLKENAVMVEKKEEAASDEAETV